MFRIRIPRTAGPLNSSTSLHRGGSAFSGGSVMPTEVCQLEAGYGGLHLDLTSLHHFMQV
jgi:hypothetical protein